MYDGSGKKENVSFSKILGRLYMFSILKIQKSKTKCMYTLFYF